MSSADAIDFLMGGAPTASFLEKGTVHRGRIVKLEKSQQRDMKTAKPKFWENGDPMWQLVITLETDERDPENPGDDGRRRIFAKANMLRSIRQAIKASGCSDPRGGTLAVKYDDDDTPSQPGFPGAKLYKAKFEPPTEAWVEVETTVSAEDDFGGYDEYGDEPF